MSNDAKHTPAKTLHEFFYREEVPYSLALMRILLPLILLLVVIPRWIHARELYSSDGAAAPLALNYGILNLPPEPNGTMAVAMMTLLAVTLVTSSIGWLTRPSLILAFVLYTWLNLLDCLGTMTKYSVISSHLLLLLSLSHCGAVWSIDACRNSTTRDEPRFPAWPRRLMQLLIGLIYLGAAFTKMHTTGFLTSDQLRTWLMTNVNNANPIGEWLSLFPAVVICMAYVAITWQIVFVFIVWKPQCRPIVLGMGTLFHASTAPLLGLYIFPSIMITSYLCYFGENDMKKVVSWLRGRLSVDSARQLSVANETRTGSKLLTRLSGTMWLLVLSTTTLAGVAAEHVADPYDHRRGTGPHELTPIDDARVEKLLTPHGPIPFEDRVVSMDIGTQMLGGVLLNSQASFAHDEPFYVQVTLSPPHGDVWLECNLHDGAGHLLQRSGQIVTRERLRAEWRYSLPPSLSPGDYLFVLSTSDSEIARKRVRLR